MLCNYYFFGKKSIEVRIRDHSLEYHGEDYPWLRDADGNIARGPAGEYLTDFTQPPMQDLMVAQAVAVAKCGLFDGIFLDWFREGCCMHPAFGSHEDVQQAKDTILQRIRAAVRDDFLIIANYNRSKMPRRAWGLNGSYMENLPDRENPPVTGSGIYKYEELKQTEDTLLWLETNTRKPRMNVVEVWDIPTEPADSPNNRRWMRIFTTLTLTHSDGYILYSNEHRPQTWYDFWDADLGRPVEAIGQQYQNIEGLFIREFQNGWAVYNRSGKTQAITLPRTVTSVSSNKQGITHLLPDLDGEIYLRIGKPFDLNRDGTVNVLDLILVSQNFGTAEGDINGDGTTNILDLTILAQQLSHQ